MGMQLIMLKPVQLNIIKSLNLSPSLFLEVVRCIPTTVNVLNKEKNKVKIKCLFSQPRKSHLMLQKGE